MKKKNKNEIKVELVPEVETEPAPEAKIEKISLKDIRNEINRQEDEDFQKKFDEFIEVYKKLTPEQKAQFFSHKKVK